ncbi:ABC transporter ATP-binding protein [Caldilinea aerophila]|jgi:branched-chain amino acid transport system ATP-binding protein|uniref:Putative branched-chain amino acid ABC transporter ATP-binding protein n=1 Tax=Caldilinea aerophila (strain DSM 14535 / JCM 11387 / NBRC 104270 / STL-6-O1) TaxID=926550 RepID=I0I6G0_CALAS|nr:ABC transporter ATP-binding protein [Caldilinea aerophila]BAM00848.1 putative branched-chain amino acid ABC transporter ATP-binding protein [Caldilinea aerophila DSM 14535 = NBRC 104270]
MVRVEDLTVAYGGIEAVRGVSLEVEEGELVTLIGNNGAGKTSTLMAISGVAPIRSGRIVIDGEETTRLAPHAIVARGVAHCPEGRLVFGRLTVQENLRLGAYQRKDSAGVKQDLDRVYALFPRLLERRTQLAGTLSGGEQQMLAIGRALMSKPRLLMLDEPSLGLAPLIVQRIFNVIQQLHEEGVTILLVEQNAHLALSIADRAYVLETGEVRLAGPAKQLIDNPEVRRAYLSQ